MWSVLHSDGVTSIIRDEWKCDYLENSPLSEEESDSPKIMKVNYSSSEDYYVIDFDCHPPFDEDFLSKIEKCLDFWDFLRCDGRMYYFYYLTFEYLIHALKEKFYKKRNKYYGYEMMKALEMIKPLEFKNYYNEMNDIITFLFDLYKYRGGYYEGLEYNYCDFIYSKEKSLKNFVIYFDTSDPPSKKKWARFPISFEIMENLIYFEFVSHELSIGEDDPYFYQRMFTEDHYYVLCSFLGEVIEKLDWKEKRIFGWEEITIEYLAHNFDVSRYSMRSFFNYKKTEKEVVNNLYDLLLSKNWDIYIDSPPDLLINVQNQMRPQTYRLLTKLLESPTSSKLRFPPVFTFQVHGERYCRVLDVSCKKLTLVEES